MRPSAADSVWFRLQWLGIVAAALFVAVWTHSYVLVAGITIYLCGYLRLWWTGNTRPRVLYAPALSPSQIDAVLRDATEPNQQRSQ